MIVDTSAVVAVLRNEADADIYSRVIAKSPTVRISAGTYVELGVVIDGLDDPVISGALDKYLE